MERLGKKPKGQENTEGMGVGKKRGVSTKTNVTEKVHFYNLSRGKML